MSVYKMEIQATMYEVIEKSKQRIGEIRQRIVKTIKNLFSVFETLFSEKLRKEIDMCTQIAKEDIQQIMHRLKEQLKIKFNKLENLEKQIADFKISPNFEAIHPLLVLFLQIIMKRKKIIQLKPILFDFYSVLILLSLFQFPGQNKSQFEHSPTNKSIGIIHKKISKPQKLPVEKEKEYICPLCCEHSKGIYEYRKHLSKHQIVLSFQCPHCQQIFNDNFHLGPHLFENHCRKIVQTVGTDQKKKEVKSYYCQFIKEDIASVRALNNLVRENFNYHYFEKQYKL